ncbi:MAG: FAD-dependent thymidylate synthase [Sulfurimonas sp.]|jgi:thymidylate synthase (FAD)|nr:FAD-dependent thymidylate synthase [Sulfurimonadaceae bacterium]
MKTIQYTLPKVTLMQESGLGVAEIAARTCYDSFEKSENESIKATKDTLPNKDELSSINSIDSSELLDDLAWTYFHHSILEHINLSYLVRGTSRGVLQEHARHRLQAISVRSTRYTMSSVLNAFVAATKFDDREFFIDKLLSFDMLVTSDEQYNKIEINTIYDKLLYQKGLSEDFYSLAVAKSSLELLGRAKSADELFGLLELGKKKRNVGDAFKHIVTDNFKVDMVITFNLRSLKNYLSLRDSGAAYFQIRWLAKAIKDATPKKYLDLIVKGE